MSTSTRSLIPISGGSDEPETPVVAPPSFVPVDDFKRLEATIGGLTELVRSQSQTIEGLQAIARGRAAPVAATEPEDATDEELVSGDPKAIRKAINAGLTRLHRDHIEPLRAQGTAAISGVVRTIAASATVEVDGRKQPRMPYYDKYKDQIDAHVARMTPQAQMDPRAIHAAHDFIVGQNVGAIIDAERQAAIRGATEDGGTATPEPSGRTGRAAGAGKVAVPTVKELFGAEAEQALKAKGQSPDEFARHMGHKDGWASYAKFVKEQDAEASVR